MIRAWHRSNDQPAARRYSRCRSGMLATALVASVADPKMFRSGELLGLDWAGSQAALERRRDRLGSISKRGDRYLRSLFATGALAVIRYAKIHGTKYRPWVAALLTRRPTKVAAIALANKLARMAWAMMARGERYNEPAALRVERDRAGYQACCEGWEGEQHVMQSRSIRRSGQPTRASALSNAA